MSARAEWSGFGISPAVTAENREFWAAAERGEFVVDHCATCRRHLFPPRGYCPGCGAREVGSVAITGPAVVYSFTVNWNSWQPGMPVPFALILAEFPGAPGFRLLGRMQGEAVDALQIGQALTLRFDEGPDGFRVPCFAPADGAP